MVDLGFSLRDVASWTEGRLHGEADSTISLVSTDSRGDLAGALFVALPGERFDGHDFVAQARDKGAIAALVERAIEGCDLPQVVVPSTLAALGMMGKRQRRRFDGKVVAITGSVGKTTTRTMLATLLQRRMNTHQPVRNFNNYVGVPLTVLALRPEHQAAVFELGCSDFGEIGYLAEIVQPDLGLITNVGAAHLEKLRDLEGVARAKGELFAAMRPEGICVVNMDDPRVAAMPVVTSRRLTYGTATRADVRLVSREPHGAAQTLTLNLMGRTVQAQLSLAGRHNAFDALAAAAAAMALGLDDADVCAGIAACRPTPGRLALLRGRDGRVVIDDTYNANPSSMAASLEVAAELRGHGRLLVVLGDMLELGEAAVGAHVALGQAVARSGAALLVLMGQHASSVRQGAMAGGLHPDDCVLSPSHEHAASAVEARATSADVVLVKGSRGMKMENVVRCLGAARE